MNQIYVCSEDASENNTEFKLIPFEYGDVEQWKKVYYDSKPTNYEISDYGRVKNTKTNHLIKPRLLIHVPSFDAEPIVNTRVDLYIDKERRQLAIKDIIYVHFNRPLTYPEEVISSKINATNQTLTLLSSQNPETYPLNPESQCYKLGKNEDEPTEEGVPMIEEIYLPVKDKHTVRNKHTEVDTYTESLIVHMGNEGNLNEKTLEQYRYRVIRLKKMGVDIYGPEKLVIEKIEAIEGLTYNIFRALLSTVNCLRKAANDLHKTNLEVDLIPKVYNKEYFEALRAKENVQKTEDQKVDVPETEELTKWLAEQYKKREYVKYIINYLMLNYATRNMDLNCQLTTDQSKVNAKEDNWMILDGNRVTFVRNSYKTAKLYGGKTNVIEDVNFVDSVRSLITKGHQYLLETGGKRIMDSSLSSYVRRRTYEGVGQRKIAHSQFVEKAKALYELCESRGTDPRTAVSDYCINLRLDKGKN